MKPEKHLVTKIPIQSAPMTTIARPNALQTRFHFSFRRHILNSAEEDRWPVLQSSKSKKVFELGQLR